MVKDGYDTIIVGGSFAGLATACFTESENVLILEGRSGLGAKQSSTCGAPVDWIGRLGAKKSILKEFDTMALHSPAGYEAVIDIPHYCTIDYKVFCEQVANRLKDAEIKTASKVTGVENGNIKKVTCGPDEYSSPIVVDGSGWRAAVASRLRPGFADLPLRIAGIETETEYDTDSVHIYFGRKIAPGGYGWIFPTGGGMARVGVGCMGKHNLLDLTKKFLEFLGVRSGSSYHGGIIPCSSLREPVVEGVYNVGDSGAQVLPGTAEGIRKTFDYAELCGGLISRVLKEEMEHREALEVYRQKVMAAKGFYDALFFIQNISYQSPDWVLERLIKKVGSDETLPQRLLGGYFGENTTLTKLGIVTGALKLLVG